MIGLLGYGVTTRSVASYLERESESYFWIMSHDEINSLDIKLYPNAATRKKVPTDVDTLIISPGIPPSDPRLLDFPKDNIYTDIDFFMQRKINTKARWIAVTATNGKSTSVAKLTHLLRKYQHDAVSVGNIGVSAFDYPQADIYVAELSSFQLYYMKCAQFDVGIIGEISPDHLDWHGDEGSYRESKYKLAKISRQCFIKPLSDENLLLVLSAEGIGLSATLADLDDFRPLPYRLTPVYDERGWRIFNDSKSTNLSSCEYALNCFESEDCIYLICGGVLKEPITDQWVDSLNKGNIKPIFFGAASFLMWQRVRKGVMVEDVQQALSYVRQINLPGTVLFSPGCSSFDMFDNYIHRGEQFDLEVADVFE